MPLFYVDSSAVVKLVRTEPETLPLRAFLADGGLVASELVLAEVPRAVRRAASYDPAAELESLIAAAEDVLNTIALLPIDHAVLTGAGAFGLPTLRTLDAVHVASAVSLLPLDAFVSFDERQCAAARLAGLRTVSPGA